jgi:hypothetical protein
MPPAAPRSCNPRDDGREALLQEREVRLTAQRILHQHLQPGLYPDHPRPDFWSDINIDLTGATLINFSLAGCAVATATFAGATFAGDAKFVRATFGVVVDFGGACRGKLQSRWLRAKVRTTPA